MSAPLPFIPLRDRIRGRWRIALIGLGIGAKFLTRKNCPCPLCPGGTDRFRFIDTNGDGTWICNQCGKGAGIDLAMRFTGLPFKEAAQRIEAILGDTARNIVPFPNRDEGKARSGAFAKRVWTRGRRIQPGDVVDCWLRARGVGMDLYPPCLRTSPLDWHRDDATDIISRHPAMLALVHGADGRPVAVHRTYLAADGRSKARVAKPRKMAGQHGSGATVRLTPPRRTLGIAEGIETALAAAKLFGIPTWSALNAHGIETFEPPPEVERLVIFGDNDANHGGQKAAETLAARLSSRIAVEVKIPGQPDTDWNDILRRQKP